MGGITSEINLGHLMMRRQKIIGSTIRARHKELKGQVMKGLESKVWPLIEKNEIKPVIFKTMNISKLKTLKAYAKQPKYWENRYRNSLIQEDEIRLFQS
ncbi:MAG: hypothetical protein Ct9H90mP4_10800 [Gammaproteobacteria bacterium]|nr:MAG: hypothetical protein Ct9H90mP4_10800 [Gammaproteobacteria bacterium]